MSVRRAISTILNEEIEMRPVNELIRSGNRPLKNKKLRNQDWMYVKTRKRNKVKTPKKRETSIMFPFIT